MSLLMGLGTNMQDTAGPQASCFTGQTSASHHLLALLLVETTRVSKPCSCLELLTTETDKHYIHSNTSALR